MADDQKNQQDQPNKSVDASVPERPLDPSRNAQDMFSDTAGMSGVTQGGLQQSSAEPSDIIRDTTEIHGGVIQDPTKQSPGGYPRSEVGNDEYKEAIRQGMSNEAREDVTDTATEPSQTDQGGSENPQLSTPQDIEMTKGGDTKMHDPIRQEELKTGVAPALGKQLDTKYIETSDAPYMQPQNGQEDAVGGDATDPRTDDDTLEMAHRAGMQPDEDPEHPEPVDIGRDIDKAEEEIKED